MEKLDQAYLTDLVTRTIGGSSNAFAELFTATQERLYTYIRSLLNDPEEAEEALKETYVFALHQMKDPSAGLPGTMANGLHHPAMFLPWIIRIAHRVCQRMDASLSSSPLIMNMPLTEAVVLGMRLEQGIKEKDIGDILNFSRGMVKRSLKNGSRHMMRAGESAVFTKNISLSPHKLSALEAARLLEEIFRLSGKSPNTVPTEALSAYTVYRKERFSLQRRVLAVLLAFFLMLPLLFIMPSYELTMEDQGLRGLPVCTIHVASLLPVGRVTAKLKSHQLPVYEATAREFTVEPTRNGTLVVTVELKNRQSLSKSVEVSTVDAKSPQLIDSGIEADLVMLTVVDDGIGVDYHGVIAVGKSGQEYTPNSVNEETGQIIFDYPTESLDVYIPDHIGNQLHLALTLE